MRVYDLSHFIANDMPVYPGTEAPSITTAFTLAENGFVEKKISLYSHTGTHLDAPYHLITGGKMLHAYPPEWFWGPALVLDVSHTSQGMINKKDLLMYQPQLQKVDFCLLFTGWSQYWGQSAYFSRYPTLTSAAATWLTSFTLKGIGVDAISVDDIDSLSTSIHKVFLQKEMVIIENLTNLAALIGQPFDFSCFPLKLKEADGSPIRAVAIQE
ncbi:MAG: cyclase family protein [Firmicutes bacterium]|nr:cyclase family protein [Bacillota bacterium]